jgi:hypothetical protein
LERIRIKICFFIFIIAFPLGAQNPWPNQININLGADSGGFGVGVGYMFNLWEDSLDFETGFRLYPVNNRSFEYIPLMNTFVRKNFWNWFLEVDTLFFYYSSADHPTFSIYRQQDWGISNTFSLNLGVFLMSQEINGFYLKLGSDFLSSYGRRMIESGLWLNNIEFGFSTKKGIGSKDYF